MRFGAVLLLALVAVSGGCHARKLLEEVPDNLCLTDPLFTDIVKVLGATGILPSGLPAGVTTFLPTNTAVAALIKTVSGLVEALGMDALTTIEDVLTLATDPKYEALKIVDRLISTLLYHIVPQPEQTLEDLAAESPVDTAFIHDDEVFTLKFSADGQTITTGFNQEVAVAAGGRLPTCESYVYPVDAVMQPADLLDIKPTTPAEAAAILEGIGGGPAPAPGPHSGHGDGEHDGDDKDMDMGIMDMDEMVADMEKAMGEVAHDMDAAGHDMGDMIKDGKDWVSDAADAVADAAQDAWNGVKDFFGGN